jgi:hypothetical protein
LQKGILSLFISTVLVILLHHLPPSLSSDTMSTSPAKTVVGFDVLANKILTAALALPCAAACNNQPEARLRVASGGDRAAAATGSSSGKHWR